MITEKLDQMSSCAADCTETLHDYVNTGTEQITDMIQSRPGRSMMLTCLAGFGVGLLVARIFAPEEKHKPYGFDRSTAERLGRNLLERMEQAIPSVIRERMTK